MPAGARHIEAQLGELVMSTKTGRDAISDIVIVNPFGLSIEKILLLLLLCTEWHWIYNLEYT